MLGDSGVGVEDFSGSTDSDDSTVGDVGVFQALLNSDVVDVGEDT